MWRNSSPRRANWVLCTASKYRFFAAPRRTLYVISCENPHFQFFPIAEAQFHRIYRNLFSEYSGCSRVNQQIRTPTWLSKESRRNSKISAVIHPHNAPLDQLVMICSIGKLRLWAHQSLPIREVSSSSLSTSQQTIHSNHQRLPSPLEFIIRTSIQTEASALTFSVRSGRRLWPFRKFCFRSARCSVIQIRMIHLCQRLHASTRRIVKGTINWRENGRKSTLCEEANTIHTRTQPNQSINHVFLFPLCVSHSSPNPFHLIQSTPNPGDSSFVL